MPSITKALTGLLAVLATMVAINMVSPSAGDAVGKPVPFSLPTGLDLHDGTIAKFGDTYYAYGTAYACGYQWYVTSPWCGFKVSSAPSVNGPWSTPKMLVAPSQKTPTGQTWNDACSKAVSGKGCFNPRMVRRPDGVFLLWFNAVGSQTATWNNAYFAMGCNGPDGGCGKEAGAPSGSTHKANMTQCEGNNGDFTIALDADAQGAVIICSKGGVLSEERLDRWWANGSGVGNTSLAGIHSVESPGVYQDSGSGKWVMTFSDPNCGYCGGTTTGYATATSLMGPWTSPGQVGFGAPVNGRRHLSMSCGGQARTVAVLDGVPYQGIDLWVGTRNETSAGVLYEPLNFRNQAYKPGEAWQPFEPFVCGVA